MNKNKVFNNNSKNNTIIKYYILVVFAMLLSAFSVNFISSLLKNIDPVFIKIPVEGIIFLLNYIIQKKIIFKN